MSQLRIKPGQIAGLMDIIRVDMIVRANIGSIVETGTTIGIPEETGMTVGISVETGMTIGIMVETNTCENYGISVLKMRGLVINLMAFKHLLQSTHFQAFADHSSLVNIVRSKREQPSDRFKKLLENVSNFSMDYGITMVKNVWYVTSYPGQFLRA